MVIYTYAITNLMVISDIVAEPMYNEYGEIQTKYEMEKSLRTAAETYATKVCIYRQRCLV